MTTTITDLDDFNALDPFFRYIITTPGYPRHVEGRKAVAELYRPYGTMIVLDRCHDLAVHHDTKTGVVVLEYWFALASIAFGGRVLAFGRPLEVAAQAARAVDPVE